MQDGPEVEQWNKQGEDPDHDCDDDDGARNQSNSTVNRVIWLLRNAMYYN